MCGARRSISTGSFHLPLVIRDPRPEADATRGTAGRRSSPQAIDIMPTILDWLGAEGAAHAATARSLMPFLRGEAPEDWRDAVFFEHDFRNVRCADGGDSARHQLGRMLATP